MPQRSSHSPTHRSRLRPSTLGVGVAGPLAAALIAGGSSAAAATADGTTDAQPSAIFILLMSALAGILIGMGYGAVRAVVRRARARRRAPGSDAATDPAGPTS
ncbi:MAG: hypothetical protein U0Q47_12685 [Mycobacterium sp.]|jgi:hypothetical protein